MNRQCPRAAASNSDGEPEAEEEVLMVSETSLPMYKQPSLTNLLSNVDDLAA